MGQKIKTAAFLLCLPQVDEAMSVWLAGRKSGKAMMPALGMPTSVLRPARATTAGEKLEMPAPVQPGEGTDYHQESEHMQEHGHEQTQELQVQQQQLVQEQEQREQTEQPEKLRAQQASQMQARATAAADATASSGDSADVKIHPLEMLPQDLGAAACTAIIAHARPGSATATAAEREAASHLRSDSANVSLSASSQRGEPSLAMSSVSGSEAGARGAVEPANRTRPASASASNMKWHASVSEEAVFAVRNVPAAVHSPAANAMAAGSVEAAVAADAAVAVPLLSVSGNCKVTSGSGCRLTLPTAEELLVGRSVRKEFPPDGMFCGTVAAYDKAERLYRIEYDDDDAEDLSMAELRAVLRPSETRDADGAVDAGTTASTIARRTLEYAQLRKQQNQGKGSEYFGVSEYNPNGKWLAILSQDNERKLHACFDSDLAAAEAWDDAARKCRAHPHGGRAGRSPWKLSWLNFPTEKEMADAPAIQGDNQLRRAKAVSACVAPVVIPAHQPSRQQVLPAQAAVAPENVAEPTRRAGMNNGRQSPVIEPSPSVTIGTRQSYVVERKAKNKWKSSEYYGVTCENGRWRAVLRCTLGDRTSTLLDCSYDDETEAAMRWDAESRQHRGDRAHGFRNSTGRGKTCLLNFPKKRELELARKAASTLPGPARPPTSGPAASRKRPAPEEVGTARLQQRPRHQQHQHGHQTVGSDPHPADSNEFEPLVIDPAASDEEKQAALFRWIDRDGDGVLSRAEYGRYLILLGNGKLTDEEWARQFADLYKADPAVGITAPQYVASYGHKDKMPLQRSSRSCAGSWPCSPPDRSTYGSSGPGGPTTTARSIGTETRRPCPLWRRRRASVVSRTKFRRTRRGSRTLSRLRASATLGS